MNTFGESQHVKKFIPLCIKKIHSYPNKTESGICFLYLFSKYCKRSIVLINYGSIGEKYNIYAKKRYLI